ncbi:GAF domain-containing protein [Dactylosporangium cerinum]|uniref:GAF domain-containing protein n=1 Tax=Dactylosporangium cerinum TaxID=1434730 RepID=A0ABV9VWX9_9ACTN
MATVSVVDADRVFLAATHGLDGVRQVGTEPGLCTSAILSSGPYLVTDAELDPRTLDHPLVRGQLGIRFYVAAPIVTSDGHRLGTVNVMDYHPRQVTTAQTTILTQLAGLVARHLDLRLVALHTVVKERQLRDDADRRAATADRRAATADRLADKLRAAAAAHANSPHPDRCQLGGATPCPARRS